MSCFKSFLRVFVFNLIFLFALVSTADEVTETYSYDPLGRLEKVRKDGELDVQYCYDKAGNRKKVTKTELDEESCLNGSILANIEPPTNLNVGTHAGEGYVVSWMAVPGAVYYRIKFGLSDYVNVNHPATSYSTPSDTIDAEPVWVKACNNSTCSLEAEF